MNEVLLITLICVVGVLVFCFIFNKVFRFTIIQSATITSLISIAIIVPYSIVNWGDGTKGAVDGGIFALYLCAPLISAFGYYLIGSGGKKVLINQKTKKIHWAPISIFSFFLVLIIVDGAFVALAQNGLSYEKRGNSGSVTVNTRFPGEVPNAYHKKEAYYNDYQRRLIEQEARGWKVSFGFLNTPVVNEENTFKIRVTDKNNLPIDNAEVYAVFIRSGELELNRNYIVEMTRDGEYEVPIMFERVGRWGLELKIIKDNQMHEIIGSTVINCKQDDVRCLSFFEEKEKERERREIQQL